MTKEELKRRIIENEQMLEYILPLSDGQDCLIYKALGFSVSDEIIYIPDVWENNLDILNGSDDDEGLSYAQRVIDNCYTGRDFVNECGGDVELAERLFHYCNWQHPSFALHEMDDKEAQIKAALDQNMSEYQAGLLCLDKSELIAKCSEIAAMRDVYDFMKRDYVFQEGDADALLRMENPLRFLAEQWPSDICGLFNMNVYMREAIKEETRAATPQHREKPSEQERASGKSSVWKQLRHAEQKSGQRCPQEKPGQRDAR